MSEGVSAGVHFQESNGGHEAPCKVSDPNCGSICGETENLRILEQFQKVYAERLKRLDGDNELAIHTLKSWVHDLTEQNTMLVHTVEELERELLKRVDLMHDQLQKTSLVIKRNEHLAKREKNEVEINLKQQVQLLQNDVSSLLDIINQAKEQGFWSVDSVKLHTVNKSQLIPTSPKRTSFPSVDNDKSYNYLEKSRNEILTSCKEFQNKCTSTNVSTQTGQDLVNPFALCMGDGNTSFPDKETKIDAVSDETGSIPVDSILLNADCDARKKEVPLSLHFDPCSQRSADQTCFPVPVDHQSIIINVLVSAEHCVSPCPKDCSQKCHPLSISNVSNQGGVETRDELSANLVSPTSPPVEETKNLRSPTDDSVSCDFSDSLENLAVSDQKSEILTSFPNPSPSECCAPESVLIQSGATGAAEKNVQSDMDSLKTQLVEKDAEIHNLLERIEEMQNIFTLTSKQVKQAIEAEQRSVQELASNQGAVILNVPPKEEVDNTQNVEGVPSWVEERLKQQQQQVTSLISRVRELESNYDIVKIERDRLAGKSELPDSHLIDDFKVENKTSSDPSMVILSKELVATRQQFAEATKQVQMLALAVKDLEKKSYETKAALTTEVADQHDHILELKREILDLETQVKEAKMQTNLKDSIIQGMRKELQISRNKNSSESGSDVDNKSRRKGFPAIPEAISICDSGVDDGELSSSSNSIQAEVNLLRTQLKEHLKQILQKDQELVLQKEKVLILEKELANCKKAPHAPIQPPQVPSITLRELEEYRLCTVEGQAAVEELNDEIDAIVSDLNTQEEKAANIQQSTNSFLVVMQNLQEKLTEPSTNPTLLYKALSEATECAQDVHQKADDFVRERRAGEQRRATRERKVNKLQEQLDASHDNMRDGIEAMEQALAERYEADRLSQREFSDGSSYHSCKDSDSSGCLKQVERLEETNAELLSNLTTMERQKRDAEAKAAQLLRELERMKEQINRRSFTEELLHTKEQTVCELQGALDSTRRQMRDLQSDFERISRERDSIKTMLEQQSNAGPLQVAELQSELAKLRNQLSSLNSKQALVEQYERRLKDSSEQAEKLSAQLNTLALNLQAKETMLSNKEEMINILQDTLDRTREEMKLLKEKSGGPSSSTDKGDPDEASGTVGAVTDEVSGSSSVWGWTRNTTARKHRVHDVTSTKSQPISSRDLYQNQQWEVVRELKLDLSEMLTQYRDCFSEVTRQTRWYRDLREAYQDLRSHAENVKREALITVNSSQMEVDILKKQFKAQSLQLCQLKEQLWEAEQGRQRAETETEELQGRVENYAQQICQFKSRLESLQTQLKETQARMEMSEEQVELRRLRDFRDIWERVARSLADINHQDKDCWGGLQWCESAESEDSQKREAKLEATLGLLLVEAGRRHRANANGGRDAVVKDCDSGSTDDSASSSTKSRDKSGDREAKPTAAPAPEGPGPGSDSQQQIGHRRECDKDGGTGSDVPNQSAAVVECVLPPVADRTAGFQLSAVSWAAAGRGGKAGAAAGAAAGKGVTGWDSRRCRVHGPGAAEAAAARSQYLHRRERDSAERRRKQELERKSRALRNVARCEACRQVGVWERVHRSFVKSPLPPEVEPREPPPAPPAPPCACERPRDRHREPPAALWTGRPRASPRTAAPRSIRRPVPASTARACAPVSTDEAVTDPSSKQDEGSERSTSPDQASDQGRGVVVQQLFVAPKLRELEWQSVTQMKMNPAEARAEAELEGKVARLQAEVTRLQDCLQSYAEADSAVREIESVVRDARDALSASEAGLDTAASLVDLGVHVVAETRESSAQTDCSASAAGRAPRGVRTLAELAGQQVQRLRLRRLDEEQQLQARRDEAGALAALSQEVLRLRSCEAEARRLALSVLCGFELEAQLRQLDAERLRRQYQDELRRRLQLQHLGAGVAAAGAERWRLYARKLEKYCMHVLWSPQGQLQGVLEENQQLRDQLGHLRAHNASLASQLQEQFEESARCLADITSSLDVEADAAGVNRDSLASPGCLRANERQTSLSTPRRGPVSRASSSASSCGGSSGSRGLDHHHHHHHHRRRRRPVSPDTGAPAPWDYSDHADLCDSGFWSLQASPPRSSSVLGASAAPAAAGAAPARLCWLGRSASPLASPETAGGTFILSTRRPRPSRH